MTDLAIDVREVRGVWVLQPQGFINAYTVQQFESAMENLIQAQHCLILINCKNLTYINSAGLGAIMGLIEEVRQQGGDILLSNLQDNVYSIFATLGFTDLYRVFATEEEAIAAVAQQGDGRQSPHTDRK